MMKRKNNLDERQEQILLQIEHRGCWLAFWGLLLTILAEQLIFGYEMKVFAGEWIVFMVLALYLFFDCMKNGIWDRRLKPDLKTNLIVSLIAAVIFGMIMGIGIFTRFPMKPVGCIAAGVISAIFVFAACMLILSISVISLKKKQKALENEPEEEEL